MAAFKKKKMKELTPELKQLIDQQVESKFKELISEVGVIFREKMLKHLESIEPRLPGDTHLPSDSISSSSDRLEDS